MEETSLLFFIAAVFFGKPLMMYCRFFGYSSSTNADIMSLLPTLVFVSCALKSTPFKSRFDFDRDIDRDVLNYARKAFLFLLAFL